MIEYPDDPVDGFPTPPREVSDREGREIELSRASTDDVEALVEMYVAFDPEDRAQGIPPTKEANIRDWLETVMAEDTLNVIAWHGDSAVGHVVLVGDGEGGYELAIFVLQAYQGAGIGTALVETVLGAAESEGIERVWLSVERWNTPAVALYEKIGFETTGDERFEKMMALRLDD
jgi:RimJ/RimL family protein N-acetyltransferase